MAPSVIRHLMEMTAPYGLRTNLEALDLLVHGSEGTHSECQPVDRGAGDDDTPTVIDLIWESTTREELDGWTEVADAIEALSPRQAIEDRRRELGLLTANDVVQQVEDLVDTIILALERDRVLLGDAAHEAGGRELVERLQRVRAEMNKTIDNLLEVVDQPVQWPV